MTPQHRAPKRAWLLALVAAVAGICAAILAFTLEGSLRAAFGGIAVVLVITAFFCFGTTSLDAVGGPPFDPDEPSPEPPVPQSPITLVYEPPKAPNDSLERDAAKPRGPG